MCPAKLILIKCLHLFIGRVEAHDFAEGLLPCGPRHILPFNLVSIGLFSLREACR